MLNANVAMEELSDVLRCSSKFLFQESKISRTFLKNLYWLISSSLSHNVTSDNPGAENGLNIMDTTTLSSALFEKLHNMSSLSSFLISSNQNVGDALSNIDAKDLAEELLLLFRCCVLMVRLNPNDLILLQKFQHAVSLYGLFPFRETFDKLYKGRIKHSSSYLYLLKQMLEVFLDEMFADRSLRESLAALESLSSKEQRSELSSIHMEIILDAIAAHFLLSITREQSFKIFYQSLVWMQSKTPYTPELSLSAAISLIKHPIMSSSTVLHAHLISLVSQVIGIGRSEVSPNIRYTEIYMSAFHESVILYGRLLSKLLLNTSINSSKQSKPAWKNFRHPQSEVYAKVISVVADWEGSWSAQRGNLFTDAKLYLISDAISYLEANINIFDESSRNNTLSFLSSLVTLILADLDQDMLHMMKEMTMQDFCLLSSIMKLMSCSMLQGVRCCLNSTSKKKVVFPGWEYLVDSLQRFEKSNHLPVYVNQFVVDGLKSHFSLSDDAIMIFVHFSYLLSMCIATGLDFLVRACLFMMMVSMEGFFLEASFVKNPSSSVNSGPPHTSPLNVTRVALCITHEQQPVIPPRMLEPEEESCSRSHSSKEVETLKYQTKYRSKKYKQLKGHSQRRTTSMRLARIRVQCDRRVSSFRVASDFQSARTLLRDKEPRTTNGVAFLECISKDAALISELADFIECQEGKDYNAYLKKKEMLRRKKRMKSVKRRWEKRKMLFTMMSNQSSKRNSK